MKHSPEVVQERFSQCYVGDVGISAITLAELRYGVECCGERRAHNAKALKNLLEDLLVAPFDDNAANMYGVLRAQVAKRTGDALDKLIAAHAWALKCILVTNNEKDFRHFPGLRIENWSK
jgi:tRNA(fMet)-specific endonuclease VapC